MDFLITLDKPWLSQNQLDRLKSGPGNRWKYRQHMNQLSAEVSRCIDQFGFTGCFIELEIFALRRSVGILDIQNAQGGLKALQDVLVMPSRVNPYGLGIIVGDDPSVLKNVIVDQHQLKAKNRAHSRSEITLSGTVRDRAEMLPTSD